MSLAKTAPQHIQVTTKRDHAATKALVDRLAKEGASVTFYLTTSGSFSMRGYTGKGGEMVIFETRDRGQGRKPLEATVKKSSGQEAGAMKFVSRQLNVFSKDKDVVYALLSHPECVGSQNSRGQGTFYLHDPEGKKNMDRARRKAKKEATDIAYGLSDLELALAAARTGSHAKQADDQMDVVASYAEDRPQEFHAWFKKKGKDGWEMIEIDALHALVTIAVREGIITRPSRNEMYTFGDLVIGESHAVIVQKMVKQPTLRDEIEKQVRDKIK